MTSQSGTHLVELPAQDFLFIRLKQDQQAKSAQ